MNIYSLNPPKVYEISDVYFRRKFGESLSNKITAYGLLAKSIKSAISKAEYVPIESNGSHSVKRYSTFRPAIMNPLIYYNDHSQPVDIKIEITTDSNTHVYDGTKHTIYIENNVSISGRIDPYDTYDVYFIHHDSSFDISVNEYFV